MKYLGYVLILLYVVLSSCEKNSEEIVLGTETVLKFNETAYLYDDDQQIEFRFKRLVEESRCPPDMICCWAGRAVIELEVNSLETFELVTCVTKPDCSEEYIAFFEEYDIELVWVISGSKRNYGDESKYSISIIVNK